MRVGAFFLFIPILFFFHASLVLASPNNCDGFQRNDRLRSVLENLAMPAGPFKGAPLNPEQATIRFLSPEQVMAILPNATPDQFWYVANFTVGDGRYLAEIPKEGIEKASLLLEDYRRNNEWHSLLRLKLSDEHPVILRPITATQEIGDATRKVADIVFDARIWLVDGDKTPYTVKRAREGYYAIRHRLQTTEEFTQTSILKRGHILNEYDLNLNSTQIGMLLGEVKNRSGIIAQGQPYSHSCQNCATELLLLFDLFEQESHFFRRQINRASRFIARNPRQLPHVLKRIGVLSNESGVLLRTPLSH